MVLRVQRAARDRRRIEMIACVRRAVVRVGIRGVAVRRQSGCGPGQRSERRERQGDEREPRDQRSPSVADARRRSAHRCSGGGHIRANRGRTAHDTPLFGFGGEGVADPRLGPRHERRCAALDDDGAAFVSAPARRGRDAPGYAPSPWAVRTCAARR